MHIGAYNYDFALRCLQLCTSVPQFIHLHVYTPSTTAIFTRDDLGQISLLRRRCMLVHPSLFAGQYHCCTLHVLCGPSFALLQNYSVYIAAKAWIGWTASHLLERPSIMPDVGSNSSTNTDCASQLSLPSPFDADKCLHPLWLGNACLGVTVKYILRRTSIHSPP